MPWVNQGLLLAVSDEIRRTIENVFPSSLPVYSKMLANQCDLDKKISGIIELMVDGTSRLTSESLRFQRF